MMNNMFEICHVTKISLFSYLKINDIDFILYQGLPGMMGSRGIIGEMGAKVIKEDLALPSALQYVI